MIRRTIFTVSAALAMLGGPSGVVAQQRAVHLKGVSPAILQSINQKVEASSAIKIASHPPFQITTLVAPSPTPEPLPTPAATSVSADAAQPTPAPPPQPPALKRGQLYQVRLSQAEELALKEGVQNSVGSPGPTAGNGAPPTTVNTVPGIVKVLADNGQELHLKPFVAGEALMFDPARMLYVGRVLVGVIDLDNSADGLHLSTPIRFRILEGRGANPDELTVASTGQPYAEAEIALPEAPGPYTVHLSSSLDVPGTPVILPVEPRFALSVDRPTIQGYGLETANVTAVLSGVADPTQFTVDFGSTASAQFAPESVQFDKSGRAHSVMRSDGTGKLQITARAAGFPETSVPIEFRWPWELITASLVGGLVGALVRVLGARKWRWTQLIASTLFGLIVFALYAVGVNILPVNPTVPVGAAVTFAVSALGSLIGPVLIAPFKKGRTPPG